MVGFEESDTILIVKIFFALSVLVFTYSVGATPVNLDVLLQRIELDPAVQSARSSYQAELERAQMRKADTGPRFFSSVSTGHYRELNSSNQIDNYYARNGVVGISYPLLGSLKRQLDALAQAQLEAQRGALAIALRRAEQKLNVRITYADWWRAQQELLLCRSLESFARKARHDISARLSAGWVRRSEATSLNQQWQTLQGRCDLAVQQEKNARSLLEMLAQMPLPEKAFAVSPPLNTRLAPPDLWGKVLEGHPAVLDRQAEMANAQSQKSPPWYSGVDSSISLAVGGEDRSGVSRYGSTIVAALNVSIPVDFASHSRAVRGEAVNRWRAARDRLVAEKRRLIVELASAVRAHQQALATFYSQKKLIEATRLRVKERQARTELEDSDAVEQLQFAQVADFQAKFDLIASWHQLWVAQATLQIFVENEDDAKVLLGSAVVAWPVMDSGNNRSAVVRHSKARKPPGEPGDSLQWQAGTYIWRSSPLLNPETQTVELANLKQAGFYRIYVGLDANQVKRMALLKPELHRLVSAAAKENMHVFLLLGEPLWLLPEHRPFLLDLIQAMSDIKFSGLHLDLEVEQLGWPVPEVRLTQWIETLSAARRVSPWPLELSSHYRWFLPDAPAQPCVPCEMQRVGIRNVTLMIYTTNPERSTALVSQVVRRWPGLHVRLAQSVETELPVTESWAHVDPHVLQRAFVTWENVLAPLGVGGIDWQDWHAVQLNGKDFKQP